MKDIIFIIPTLSSGGAEKVLVNLVNNLNREKYQITLLSIFDIGENRKNLSKDINYRYFRKKPMKGNSFFFKFFNPTTLYNRIIKNKYDIVISFLQGPATRIVSGCPHEDTVLLNWVHTENFQDRSFVGSFRSKEEFIKSYNKFDANIFVSENVKKLFSIEFPEIKTPLKIKYNIVDDEEIENLSKEHTDAVKRVPNRINLISVGRFVKVKGYSRLIKIIKKLVDQGYDIHLYLIGKGRMENEYHKLISKYNLKNHVTILGFQNNPYKFVNKADLFICSSYKEGFSTAVTEALILGVPVITTDCSGMHELLGQENMYGVITDNNTKALYDGIEGLLSEPTLLKKYKTQSELRGKKFKKTYTILEIEKLFDSINLKNKLQL